MIQKKCKNCKKEFDTDRQNTIFCSRKCIGENRIKEGKFNICKKCKKKFHVQNNNKHRKYCSVICYHLFNTIKVKCCYCGIKFHSHKYRKNTIKYCSKKCMDKAKEHKKYKIKCKICKKTFYGINRKRKGKVKYCNKKCYHKDKNLLRKLAINTNLHFVKLKGLNKFELSGRQFLKSLGFKRNKDFKEQYVLLDRFCVDVYFPKKRVVIQWDGDYWHGTKEKIKSDKKQNRYMKKFGYKVIRIKQSEFKNIDKVISRLKRNNVCK